MAPSDGTGGSTPDANGLAAGIAAAAGDTPITAGPRPPAPVDRWDPPFCGDLDMEIRADGSWYHLGTPITREAMVQLFASVLKREGDRYFLVTPVEKLGIRVIDAPFVAVDAVIEGGEVRLTTNLGEVVTAGADHAIRVNIAADGTPRPYVHVRRGLEALIDRKTFYRLVEGAVPDAGGQLVLTSSGVDFVLGAG